MSAADLPAGGERPGEPTPAALAAAERLRSLLYLENEAAATRAILAAGEEAGR